MSKELENFNEHVHGRRSPFIDKVSTYIGELPSILSYGARHIARTLDAEAQLQPDRICVKQTLRVREFFTLMSGLCAVTGIATFLKVSGWMGSIFLLLTFYFWWLRSKTKNPVIAVIDGPRQEIVSYLTSNRIAESRQTLDGFRKLFHLEKMKSPDVVFFVHPETGRHAVDASSLRKYLSEDKYIRRSFVCAYNRYSKLFEEWAKASESLSTSAHMNLTALSILAESILGFSETPWEVLEVVEDMETVLSEDSPYWEIFGFKIALTASQKKYLNTRNQFAKIAPKFLRMNRESVLATPDNFTMDLSKQVGLLTEGPDAKAEDYLDSLEVAHGALAMMLAAGNPSTLAMGTLYLVREYLEETARILPLLNRIREESNGSIEFLYEKTKACTGEFEYLQHYYYEALRYNSPANTVARFCPHTIKMAGHELPPGSVMATNVRSQCRDVDQWEAPTAFNPSRFKQRGKYNLHTWPFIPFSTGERKCPGTQVARAMFFAFLFAYVGKYEIQPDSNFPEFRIPDGKAIARASRIHRAYMKKIN